MNNIKISVIIPFFNRDNTIKNCIYSVINQSYPVEEILCIDDGSTDKSVEMIKEINDNRIKILKNHRKKGAQGARNQGIIEATSDWIAFLDSDDEWLENKISNQVSILKENNFDLSTFIYCNCFIVNANNQKRVFNLPIIKGVNCFSKMLEKPGPMFQGMLVSKKSLEEIKLLDEDVPSFQEWDTSIQLSKICNFIHIEEPLFLYHLHGGETISKNRKNDFLGWYYILNKYKNEYISNCDKSLHYKNLKDLYNKFFEYEIYKNSNKIEYFNYDDFYKELFNYFLKNNNYFENEIINDIHSNISIAKLIKLLFKKIANKLK